MITRSNGETIAVLGFPFSVPATYTYTNINIISHFNTFVTCLGFCLVLNYSKVFQLNVSYYFVRKLIFKYAYKTMMNSTNL